MATPAGRRVEWLFGFPAIRRLAASGLGNGLVWPRLQSELPRHGFPLARPAGTPVVVLPTEIPRRIDHSGKQEKYLVRASSPAFSVGSDHPFGFETLVWWFRSSLHLRRTTFKRTSEPKPHSNHSFLVSFSNPKFAPIVAAETANFGFGILARNSLTKVSRTVPADSLRLHRKLTSHSYQRRIAPT